jgi:hypothetical protein
LAGAAAVGLVEGEEVVGTTGNIVVSVGDPLLGWRGRVSESEFWRGRGGKGERGEVTEFVRDDWLPHSMGTYSR